ncbi:17725_t:CDS:2, partial [Acaulospora morrowiae]
MVTDRPGKYNEYDLLEERKKRNETDDPEVEEYFKAKELFTKGYELASKIPDNSEEETLKKYEREIFESTQYLVEAFLLDDKATEMSSRIMSLAQQYEKLLKLGEDSEKKEIEEKVVEIKDEEISEQKKIKDSHASAEEADASEPEFTRESLILVIWLLFNGKQYKFCIQTLTVALNQLEPALYPRLLHLRASCHLAIGDHKSCVKDLERLTSIKSDFVSAYNILGSIHMSQGDRLDAARNFKIYIEKANKDSLSYSHALYSLCALTIQNATSATTGNRLRIQQAFNYYQKAKEAEIRYENLYGRKPEMTDVKLEKDSKKEAERLAPILQQLFKKCNHCNSLSRKNENGE